MRLGAYSWRSVAQAIISIYVPSLQSDSLSNISRHSLCSIICTPQSVMRNICIFTFLTISVPCFLTASIPLENPENPTIVLVPGAWHLPQHYFRLKDLVERAGYDFISQKNPSCGSLNPNAESAAKDAAYIRDQVLIPLLDAGKTVVLAMHSYGGSPGAAAAIGLSQKERIVAGRPGGIIGLIFICAVLTRDGQSLLDLLPGQVFDPWVIQEVRFFLQTINTAAP